MILDPEIRTYEPRTFVGMRMPMTFAGHDPSLLWSRFMPRRKEIPDVVGTEMYSIESYSPGFFEHFRPDTEFDKWATVRVNRVETLPEGMERLDWPGGLYAVFLYRGTHAQAKATFDRIFLEWLPRSGYRLDDRPHLAVMGEKYRKDDPESEEEIWIPVCQLPTPSFSSPSR
jgi:AraC family transcriptional regulator